MPAAWSNADGLQVPFASYWKDKGNFTNRPRAISNGGIIKQLVFDYDLSLVAAGTTAYPDDLNNDGTNDGFDEGQIYIPANSNIVSAHLIVAEGAVGGTSVTLGTYTKTGSAIVANGLITATEGVTANLTPTGKRVLGNGSQVAVTSQVGISVGAADAYLAISAVGTYTAGKGRIVISYVDPVGDLA